MLKSFIHLVVGLPGSGKTFYINKNAKENDCIIDDIKSLDDIQDYICNCIHFEDCWISDVNFCDSNILKKAKKIIKNMKYMHEIGCGHKYAIIVHYFENNDEVCKKNINYRITKGDERNVWDSLERFKEIYKPPENAMTVFDTDDIKDKTIWDI